MIQLGLDLGTSGVRACAIDLQRRPLAEAALPLPPSQRAEGGVSRQQPQDWLDRSLEVLALVCAQLGPAAASVRALAVDGTSASLLACRPDGTPLGPALMYDDCSCAPELEPLAGVIPSSSPARSASASLAKLRRFQRQFTSAFLALHQADWIAGQLCGRFGWSDEHNALKLGYDPLQRRWPDWLLGLAAAHLPQVYPAGAGIGQIQPEMAARTGLPPGCLICAGTTDSTAAALASGIQQPGQALSVLGSTLVLKVLAEQPLFASEYGIYSHRLGDLWLVGGASNSGGAVLLEFFSREQLAQMTPQLRPEQPTGLDYYPLPRPGERFPRNDPQLAPRLEPRPADALQFFQGLLEGISAIEREGYRLLAQLGAPYPSEVFSSGGGSTNPAWRQIRQNHLGVPVHQAAQQQAAYGAALLAAGV
ncbi:MAG: FGGY-family carbohydrate kinase [Gammaproteobacteria bacterium]|nr:FGGY-family carbohydrate kinase [Gammaproteobacteria bacterium]